MPVIKTVVAVSVKFILRMESIAEACTAEQRASETLDQADKHRP